MKKPNKQREILLHRKRERKILKRIRLNKTFQGYSSVFNREQTFREAIDRKIIKRFSSPLLDFFVDKNFIQKDKKHGATIKFKSDFSLCSNYENAIESIRDFINAIFSNIGDEIILDFSNCKTADQPALFVLQILRMDFQEELNSLNSRLRVISSQSSIKIIHSKVQEVNKLLFVTGLIPQAELKIEGLMPLTTLGYYKGNTSQKHYSENRKGAIGTNITNYINHCLSVHGYLFTPTGKNQLEGLVSEVLNNAEDHSPFNTYYVTANLLGEMNVDPNANVVGEMNLAFLNFGFSFFEGFEETKTQNIAMYEQMEILYNQVNNSIFSTTFSKENLFTLYALQDGISRLKYEGGSRGNGSMKFINSFFSFGDYEDELKHYHPNLTIHTGGTQLVCDNKYKPFHDGNNVYFISLNSENDLSVLPEKSNLKQLKSAFPGTLLTTRIYLNKEHLRKKISNNGNTDN